MEEEPSEHARITFRQIIEAGDPVRPLDFPPPIVHPGICDDPAMIVSHIDDELIYDIRPGEESQMRVLHRVYHKSVKRSREEGYWFRKKLQDAIYGSVWAAVKVYKDNHAVHGRVWKTTNQFVAIKRISWSSVHKMRGRHIEDPLKEIACLQLIGNDHPNVMGSICALQDTLYLYSILPYCDSGELFNHVTRQGGDGGLEEPEARYWFRQILMGLHHLQSRGICHRDLSLENILIHDNNCLVMDMGMCLRVPYSALHDKNEITDVFNGGIRRLIIPQGSCGKISYISSEVYNNEMAFDGFAIDLWAAGSILYIMLVGFPPWDAPNITDMRYLTIISGRLHDQLKAWDVHISNEAADLLQTMLRENPEDRLTLAEVMMHPWVMNEDLQIPITVIEEDDYLSDSSE